MTETVAELGLVKILYNCIYKYDSIVLDIIVAIQTVQNIKILKVNVLHLLSALLNTRR